MFFIASKHYHQTTIRDSILSGISRQSLYHFSFLPTPLPHPRTFSLWPYNGFYSNLYRYYVIAYSVYFQQFLCFLFFISILFILNAEAKSRDISGDLVSQTSPTLEKTHISLINAVTMRNWIAPQNIGKYVTRFQLLWKLTYYT